MQVPARHNTKLIPLRSRARRISLNQPAEPFPGKFPIHSTNRVDLVDVAEIVYCEASSNYTSIVLDDGRRFTISRTLKWTEEQLKKYGVFSRFHQSFVVNRLKVVGVEKSGQWHMELIGGTRLPISRSARSKLGAMLAVGQV